MISPWEPSGSVLMIRCGSVWNGSAGSTPVLIWFCWTNIMMDQFKKVYWPGGMGLNHSQWMLVAVDYDARAGAVYRKLKVLARADYT